MIVIQEQIEAEAVPTTQEEMKLAKRKKRKKMLKSVSSAAVALLDLSTRSKDSGKKRVGTDKPKKRALLKLQASGIGFYTLLLVRDVHHAWCVQLLTRFPAGCCQSRRGGRQHRSGFSLVILRPSVGCSRFPSRSLGYACVG